jgi:hypothetical protein
VNKKNFLTHSKADMNERIKAWIKEVGEDCYEYSEMAQDVWFNKEKFAELIVRECMDVVRDINQEYDGGSTVVNAADEIKEHFGVE